MKQANQKSELCHHKIQAYQESVLLAQQEISQSEVSTCASQKSQSECITSQEISQSDFLMNKSKEQPRNTARNKVVH